MKTITIPKRFGYPSTKIVINGATYSLKSGEEISVDDALAEVIENALALEPKSERHFSRFAQFAAGTITEIKSEELEGVTTITPCAFYNYDGLKSIMIPDSVTHIGYSAFGNCNGLANVSMGNGVKTVGYNAFEFCTALTSIEIPKSVTILGSNAFKECTGLKKVTVRPISPPSINGDTFTNLPTTCIIEVPSEALNAYKSAPHWSVIASQITAIKE